MKTSIRLALMLSLAVLSGCSESITGVYEAFIQVGDEQPRMVGLAVIQEHRILADRQSVDVIEWKNEDDLVTAYGVEGGRLAQFKIQSEGVLVQSLPQSNVIYKRIDM